MNQGALPTTPQRQPSSNSVRIVHNITSHDHRHNLSIAAVEFQTSSSRSPSPCHPQPYPHSHYPRPHPSNLILPFIPLLPPILPHSQQILKPQPRRINRTLRTRINKEIIQKSTKSASQKRSNHRYPEIIPSCTPNFVAVADDVGHEAGSEISGEVYGVACFPIYARNKSAQIHVIRDEELA